MALCLRGDAEGPAALAASVRALAADAGPAAPALFVALYVVGTVLAVPATFLTVAGAAAFGLWGGFALVWLGATLGATAAFFVGRTLARDLVARHLPASVASLEVRLSREGPWTVLVLRLLPFVPYLAVNYACGLARTRPRDFVVGTALGIVPLHFVYVYAATAAWELRWSEPATWLPGLAVLAVLGGVWALRYRRGRSRSGVVKAGDCGEAPLGRKPGAV